MLCAPSRRRHGAPALTGLLLLGLLGLAGCGQKGALYLPTQAPAAAEARTTTDRSETGPTTPEAPTVPEAPAEPAKDDRHAA